VAAAVELLSLQGLRKGYGRGGRWLRVLADVSLTVDPGEIVAVVGGRGEGKTTLLKIAAGLELPDAGEVCLSKIDLVRCSPDERARQLGVEVAWVHRDGTGVNFEVIDYVGLPLAIGRGHGRRSAERLATQALARVGAADCAHRRWGELSNWERVLVSIARGVVGRPRLMVVDDVIDGVGMRRTREAGELLRSLVEELGCGLLMSASDLEAALVADRVWTFERGGLRLFSDQARTDAEVIDFPGLARRARAARGTGL
jgi:predicted ABC-type transport system involved in lysophospholipase L1 biosynthesis ATPase subunit